MNLTLVWKFGEVYGREVTGFEHLLLLKASLHHQKQGILGGMANSRFGEGRVQVSLDSWCDRKKGNAQLMGHIKKA